jgi:predicted anti-sigma-YlaC factor YlaD
MVTCREVLDLVTEYLEDGLPPRERVRFERHVAICPPCRGYIGQMRETLRVAGTLREEELSPDTRNALLDAFRNWRSGR